MPKANTMVPALAFHILAAVVWVGGMFFAYLVLRPSAGALAPEQRLPLWERVFARFLPWVWAAVIALLASGYSMIVFELGGFAHVRAFVNVMMALGLLMTLLFLHLFFAPWRRFRRAVAAGDLAAAGRDIEQIRRLVLINLVLGLATVIIGATGPYW